MANDRVLVVEDEPMAAEVVERYLRRDGFEVEAVRDGSEALPAFERFRPDLVVLDLMLPGVDGIEVCRRLRTFTEAPVIMLTARGEEIDRLLGLGIGADDYITKPFSPRELVARVKAVLRRSGRQAAADGGDALRFGDLRINGRTRVAEDRRGQLALTGFPLGREPAGGCGPRGGAQRTRGPAGGVRRLRRRARWREAARSGGRDAQTADRCLP